MNTFRKLTICKYNSIAFTIHLINTNNTTNFITLFRHNRRLHINILLLTQFHITLFTLINLSFYTLRVRDNSYTLCFISCISFCNSPPCSITRFTCIFYITVFKATLIFYILISKIFRVIITDIKITITILCISLYY